ncbi:hypothetical protein OBBRIDRAFT_58664 [Obba rivulosa]|uniref:Uncharacterized protein n=1 Tax=Obba rivulosa TaxID=1052685 RepID=A0A8E2AVL2_9APHY|nr:hypothetical protein OBBRIDRAFT_58664 [Obba rivulosa]
MSVSCTYVVVPPSMCRYSPRCSSRGPNRLLFLVRLASGLVIITMNNNIVFQRCKCCSYSEQPYLCTSIVMSSILLLSHAPLSIGTGRVSVLLYESVIVPIGDALLLAVIISSLF